MKTIEGRAVDAVTGVGVPHVGIGLLSWDPKAGHPYRSGDLIGADVDSLAALPVRRLAATTTDRSGRFVLRHDGADGPYVVVAQEVAKRPGLATLIIGATASLRSGAEDGELVSLPIERSARRRAGLEPPDPQWKQRAGAPASTRSTARKGSVAEAYRKARDAALTTATAASPRNGFFVGLPVLRAGEQNSNARLAYDAKAKSWTTRRGGKRVKLRFRGIAVAGDNTGAGRRTTPAARYGVEVDAAKRTFRVLVPPLVVTLRATPLPSAMRREGLRLTRIAAAQAAIAASACAASAAAPAQARKGASTSRKASRPATRIAKSGRARRGQQ